MKDDKQLRIGLFGIGLDTYWPQFEGLKDRLTGYLRTLHGMLEKADAEVINAGLIDNIDSAFEAGHKLRQADVDIIFLYVTTYALSSTVLPVVRHVNVPVIILDLVPEPSIDYYRFNSLPDRTAMTGEWLAYCSPCPVPELANVFLRTGIKFHQVTGALKGDPFVWNEIADWVGAARVKKAMAFNRMGCMGHYYSGMLDVYTDLTRQLSVFGGHFEHLEVDELSELRKAVSKSEITGKLSDFNSDFDISSECHPDDLSDAARTSVALDKMIAKYKLGSMAYYYKGSGSDNEESISTIIPGCSLLTGRGIPCAGEYEIKNAQAMKIMDTFGAGGSFTEYYALDLKDDFVLMGHDGPGHMAIAEGKIRIKPLEVYHGKVGRGLSVEMSVKHGPVTLLSVVEKADGKIILLCAEGESVAGPILEIGNTNSRYKFPIGAREFVNQWNENGPAHHCAVGIGHIASKILKLGALLEIDVIRIC